VPNPAFIVEGDMEQKILGRICRGHPIRKIGCNGDNVSIERMCDFIAAQIRTLNNKNYPIIIIFDREKRAEDCESICKTAIQTLHKLGLADHDIRIFVADREFEDWYLMDRSSICTHFQFEDKLGPLNGKGGIEKLLESGDICYHETTIGVDIFFIVSYKKISESCNTFQSMMEVAIEVDCRHFDQTLI